MKHLLQILSLFLLATIWLTACDKKDPKPDTDPAYYFRFKADGVAYDYKYECETTFSGSACNMAGFQSTSTGWGGTYQIYGHSFDIPSARGEVRFYLNKEDFNNLDTIILDGSRSWVEVYKMPNGIYNAGYVLDVPLMGKIIFTEKNTEYLKGIFEFETFKIVMNEETGVSERTDSVVKFTEGEFFVGRTN